MARADCEEGRVCSRPGSSFIFPLTGLEEEEGEVWSPSLNVCMVRALLSTTVVVVVTREEEEQEEEEEEEEEEKEEEDLSRMWTTSGSQETWDTPAIQSDGLAEAESND